MRRIVLLCESGVARMRGMGIDQWVFESNELFWFGMGMMTTAAIGGVAIGIYLAFRRPKTKPFPVEIKE